MYIYMNSFENIFQSFEQFGGKGKTNPLEYLLFLIFPLMFLIVHRLLIFFLKAKYCKWKLKDFFKFNQFKPECKV